MQIEVNGENISSSIPDSPTEKIGFAIKGSDVYFTPMYYPERFNITTSKKLNKVPAGCQGQKISISTLKNSTIHVTGKVHTSDIESVHKLARTTEPVEILTPVIETNGMEAVVKKAERGELAGWDNYPKDGGWMFNYTLDLVSTGKDEYETSSSVDRFQLREELDTEATL